MYKETFENWTAYDNWLVKNYENYSILAVDEINGKIEISYQDKDKPIPEDD